MKRQREIVKEIVKNIGLLDDQKIQRALDEQFNTKERLAKIMVRLGYVSSENVGNALIPQLGILPLAIQIDHIDLKAVNTISPQLAVSHRIVPFKLQAKTLFLATDDPINFLASDFFERITSLSVDMTLADQADIDKALAELYTSKQKETLHSDLSKLSEDIKDAKGDDDAPVIKLVNMLIEEALKRRASDIHVEPLEHKFRIRYRIDGVLHEIQGPPKRLQGSIISRLKIMAGMDIAEKRLPQDGRIKLALENKELDLRVSTLPAIHGESVVMRILDKSSFMVGLEDMGFLPENRRDFERLINLPNGMILVTGPTGSGKTTTLYATLSHINQKERKVITIEDPVEYQLDGINQVQVKPQINLTFASGLRSMLRQAPDIIMVGEIRDLETAEIAVQSALTGHLIFSTLHTNDAAGAIMRLADMGIKPYLAASTVQGILAQRLVRTICPSCREVYQPSKEEMVMLSIVPGQLKDLELYKGKGCSACNDTGFKGRMGIYELLVMNDSLRELVLENAPSAVLCKKAREFGMRTLKEDGMEKVKRGHTTIEEVLRVTQDA
ncbi:MAG: type II secretion system protein GspE [Omnitrophica bacterium GWA2_41_15]|nr:MAG: type II secretion system protein GspE [Omnitrophica bacterium GWA2_41_15]HAZ10025.1 type II secretion system protein GspE [Candidatus Omnitrophota bacterium]